MGFTPPPLVKNSLRALYPLPWGLERLHDLGLLAALFRVEVVLPPSCLGEGHEDRLDTPSRLEAEDSPSVVDQVELHVSFPGLHRRRRSRDGGCPRRGDGFGTRGGEKNTEKG